MRRIGENIYTEIYFWGCNPSFITTNDGVFMIDAPQQPIDALRWREVIATHGPVRYLVNTEPHGDHINGNAYFPGIEVIGQVGMKERYERAIPQMTGAERLESMKQTDPDSIWLLNHPSYPPNPPTRLFTEELNVTLGDQTVHCIHHPGHTPPQTSVYLPKEQVVFTGDNVFCRVKTFIQEANPWEWLESLDKISALDVEVIVPGHGEPCDKSYLKEQAQIIQDWLGAVEDFIRRGLILEDALKEPRPNVDPYPIGQRLFANSDNLDQRIITNLYNQISTRGKQ
ncbi:MAG: MBL fold metallo-hydrolase [Dehalococcoidia bacterium]|nr:MBL fold metallo-hydrolase [Dehalococcoidia bacterium]